MDELRGKQGIWRFDGETVSIHYRTGWRADPLLVALGRCRLPVAAVSLVEFTPRGVRGKDWRLRLRLHERADPFTAVGAGLAEKSQPFLLTGRPATELLAEYYADQFAAAAEAARDDGDPAPPEQLATGLVPPLPLHVQTSEGTAFFDGEAVRLVWSGEAGSRKRREQRREFPLSEIRRAEWVPTDGWNEGYLRIVTHEAGTSPAAAKPGKDLSCLLTNSSRREEARTLLLAATVTAHLWARDTSGPARPTDAYTADERTVYDRIRELGRLRDEGLLTEEEFRAKKTELLDRL
ncbi:DUF4429 domain-containing protein [Thermobifida halotolerans]|uniref:DUF4429 domain-containing protein n=1 Tax=Thermobifida halotolerans TaxID=483545 RepID=A0A399G740_9ACTN|nr:DUF4429 domain-containing protein [Thermobifida halotolerans]UOE20386.1 DUF4429 domain-containing protein [Thermobifida halotolerans]